jgi:RHS repeat-associated protein
MPNYEGDMLESARAKRGLPGRRLVEPGGTVQAGQTTPCFDADFLPYGQEVDFTSTCGSNYRFEGKERDLETGNDDLGARYYRSGLGRWLSADWSSVPAPVPYANLTNPQTLNLYAMVSDNPETFADLDGHCSMDQEVCNANPTIGGPTDPVSSGKDVCNVETSKCDQKNITNANGADQDKAQQQKEVGAEVYAEKTNGTADEYKAMASVIVNRANSGEQQYVQKGEDVNIHNVVSDKQQLQAYGSTNYNNFYNGSPRVSKAARATVEGAVGDVFKNGATTKATFFIANQGGAAPTRAQIHALGSVVPASPATVGGVYLYVVKPPGPGP